MQAGLYAPESGNISMGLVGDAMLARALTPHTEAAYLALAQLLRDTDVGFANLETTVRTQDEGMANFTQGTPMSTPPALLGQPRADRD
jgi:hypothetical protein